MFEKKQLQIFEGKRETLLLAFPFLFFPFVFIELYLGLKIDGDLRRGINFLNNIVFFNALHIIFTGIFVGSFPEIKLWIKDYNRKNKSHFLKKVGVFLVTLFFTFTVAWKTSHHVFMFSIFVVQIYGIYHILRQNYGFIVLYNQKTQSQTPEILKNLNLLICAVAGFVVFVFLGTKQLNSREFPVLNKFLTGTLWSIQIISSIVLFALVLGSLWIIYRSSTINKYRQLIFFSRFLLIPFIPFSFLASVAIQSIHGIEYLLISTLMTKRSKVVVRDLFAPISIISIIVVSILTFLSDRNGVTHFFKINLNEITSALFVISFTTISAAHYYVDGILFAFKDESNRKHISPLIS